MCYFFYVSSLEKIKKKKKGVDLKKYKARS